jgi:hypothetical protein
MATSALLERELVYDTVLAYRERRRECAAVWGCYGRWGRTSTREGERAHAAHRAALDREDAAAKFRAEQLKPLDDLLPAEKFDPPRSNR